MWIRHLFSLLAVAGAIFIEAIGTTWLGKALDIAFVAIITTGALNKIRQKGGWSAMRLHWDDNMKYTAKVSVLAALIIYIPVALWSIGSAVYKDHQGLVQRSRTQSQLIATNNLIAQQSINQLNQKFVDCGTEKARLEGAKGTLDSQNRDQQNTINNCQTQAIKLLQPQPFQWTVSPLEKAEVFGTNSSQLRQRWILLANREVSPVQFTFSCSRPIVSAEVKVVGTSAANVQTARINDALWSAQVLSPNWGPNSPILVITTISKTSDEDTNCNFHVQSLVK